MYIVYIKGMMSSSPNWDFKDEIKSILLPCGEVIFADFKKGDSM